MRTVALLVAAFACAMANVNLAAADEESLAPELEKLRPLLGKTFRGTFKDSKPEKPVVDTVAWERALNGKAVRSLHSINDGVYGGETIFMWDPKDKVIRYHYFTTGGFMTTGTLKFEGDKIVTNEKVQGSAGGVAEVRGISEIRADGSLHVKTEHLREGAWSPGHEVVYSVDPAAKVVFK